MRHLGPIMIAGDHSHRQLIVPDRKGELGPMGTAPISPEVHKLKRLVDLADITRYSLAFRCARAIILSFPTVFRWLLHLFSFYPSTSCAKPLASPWPFPFPSVLLSPIWRRRVRPSKWVSNPFSQWVRARVFLYILGVSLTSLDSSAVLHFGSVHDGYIG